MQGWRTRKFLRIGPRVKTGYVKKGDSIIEPYEGRYGKGYTLEEHKPGEYRRHNVYYFVEVE